MRRWPWLVAGLIVIAGIVGIAIPVLARAKAPIKVGLLHSLSGPLAISERSMLEAENLAIKEINAQGGLLGRSVVVVVGDGRSDPEVFASEARRLIEVEKVNVLIGCYSSACRKSVRPIVERANHLLIYPVSYEGMEESPNIVYSGSAPNQMIIPTVKWSRDFLKAKSYYLVGSDSVYPRAVHAIIKDQLKALGGTLVGEDFLSDDRSSVTETVRRALDAKPDAILTTIEGDLNVPFYSKIRVERSEASKNIPIISMTVTEEELRELPIKEMTNDYLTCSYFQSVSRPANAEFIRRFKEQYGADRVTSDSIVAAYGSVLFWAQAVRETESEDQQRIRDVILRQSRNSPEGVICLDPPTRHAWRPLFIGKIQGDGQVEIVWKITKSIRPEPFPLSRTREDWETFLQELRASWDGNWSPPTRKDAPDR
jgi:urea transport system substrate-binding protein